MMKEDLQAVGITVTPRMTHDGFECDISGQYVVDDAICLPKGQDHDLTFTIAAGSAWTWDTSTPFASRVGKCPAPGTKGGPLTPKGANGTTFSVNVPSGNKNIFHYRLNFSGGDTFDPIIIRD